MNNADWIQRLVAEHCRIENPTQADYARLGASIMLAGHTAETCAALGDGCEWCEAALQIVAPTTPPPAGHLTYAERQAELAAMDYGANGPADVDAAEAWAIDALIAERAR